MRRFIIKTHSERNKLMKGIPQKDTPTGVKWYVVIYLYNNTFHGVPFNSEEAARKYGAEFVDKMNKEQQPKSEKYKGTPYIKNWYIMKRNLDKYDNGEVI